MHHPLRSNNIHSQRSTPRLMIQPRAMDKNLKPIPAFYACYLLRSTVRHQSLYVGSTPNPFRRLKQHNGESKGGAARTSKDNLRPWEMTCLVTGFPSKIAALQFEWAWQNTHLTRHVSADSRLTPAKSTTRISPKTGRTRRRPARPRLCLTDRLANLHLLLQASSFSRWPLQVTFYSEEIYKVWTKWTSQHVDGLRNGIEIKLDESSTSAAPSSDVYDGTLVSKGIEALDVGYSSLKPHVEKSKQRFENAEWLHCSVCKEGLPASGVMTLVCPSADCDAVTHLECLSASFLQAHGNTDAIVPTAGFCPRCGDRLQWADLVKELSLRMRGEKEVRSLYAKKRKQKTKDIVADSESEMSADEDLPEYAMDAADDEIEPLPANREDAHDVEWHELPESSDVERDKPKMRSGPDRVFKRPKFMASNSEPVIIEDSDWDDAEILD
ncbi:Structure-specific endonuclease subunit slx1 [Teratosphaeria destructans]|uniref:Structure-specific endonuclease subunit slx1 n=1 Tax=Teratosphaeria destructans TaxID=418781 RepID=A0A9W7W718_9PEZI|nr:Structure-specific endonuclease subunit slx1 [Teratosphaeria destructans]